MDSNKPTTEVPKVSQSVQFGLSVLPNGAHGDSDVHKTYWGLEERKNSSMKSLITTLYSGNIDSAYFYLEEVEAFQDLQGLLFNEVVELAHANYRVVNPENHKITSEDRAREFCELYLTPAQLP